MMTGVQWFQPVDEPANMVAHWAKYVGHPKDGDTPPGDVPNWGKPIPDPTQEVTYNVDPAKRPFGFGTWDCREWQMYQGRPSGAWDQKEGPRYVAAGSDHQVRDGKILVNSEYVARKVKTHQRWVLADLKDTDVIQYDCLYNMQNTSGKDIVEYSQFFANYTHANGWLGCFFWDHISQSLRNFWDIGCWHIHNFTVGPDSPFVKLGEIPHIPRYAKEGRQGKGAVAANWLHPVLVSQATDAGWRHVILLEEAFAAGLTQGMTGVAMDFVLYPGKLTLAAGEDFSAHVRHLIIRNPGLPDSSLLEKLWSTFNAEHETFKALLS